MKNLVLVASLMLGTSVHAATYLYEYQGQILEGSICEGFCDEAFSGSLWLDESLFPGGTIAGSMFNVTYNSFDGSDLSDTGTWAITSSAGLFEGSFSGMDLPDFAKVTGKVAEAIFGVVAESGMFDWTFDDDRQIVDWDSSGLYGGSNDFAISAGGDTVADGRSAGPGNWTLTASETLPVPSPVPLPAGGLLIMGAIGALGVAARKRKARG